MFVADPTPMELKNQEKFTQLQYNILHCSRNYPNIEEKNHFVTFCKTKIIFKAPIVQDHKHFCKNTLKLAESNIAGHQFDYKYKYKYTYTDCRPNKKYLVLNSSQMVCLANQSLHM